ncbi:NAD(P)-binding protein [Pyrenochaeta sp. DS3sAY3a]|nr:NAD(P)-binding protein [Pyrenochaeta sp. DS3sAY3a]
MPNTQGHNIAIVGATGTIGSVTLEALSKAGQHKITPISRNESNATFPSGLEVKKGDYGSESFLKSALSGKDVLILQLGIFGYENQTAFIHAAAKAGVKYVLPTEFGSDPYAPFVKGFPMLAAKKKYRDLIEELGMSWIAVVNNPWFDWSLSQGHWGVDIKERKATLYRGAEGKFNTTTLRHVAEGVAQLLSLPEEKLREFANSPVYLSSFETTQRDILNSAIRATGTQESDWEIVTVGADVAIQECREEVAQGNHMAFIKEFYITHMTEGSGGNYQSKAIKDAKTLGLNEDNIDEEVRAVVQEITSSA